MDEPFPEEWEDYLADNVPYYDALTPEEQTRLRGLTRVIVAEKSWEGAGGLILTDEIKVTIAAQSALLLLGLTNHDFYPNVHAIIVYPAAYRVRHEEMRPGGVIHRKRTTHLGEAWGYGQGPVIVSWADALHGAENPEDAQNVVLHEFAHKLDMRDGDADGVPPLPGGPSQYDSWAEVMQAEYNRLVDEAADGDADILDDYGAENPAEFFAVATETFFEKPRQLRRKRPRLYEVLKRYYNQDPAARLD